MYKTSSEITMVVDFPFAIGPSPAFLFVYLKRSKNRKDLQT